MLFSIIFSIDCPRNDSIKHYQPDKKILRRLELTECNDVDDYEDVFGKLHKHRKYIGILTKEEFDNFIYYTGLTADNVDTMGSLGTLTPNGDICFGIQPAISFDSYHTNAVVNCYVTPYPKVFNKKQYNERDFERI